MIKKFMVACLCISSLAFADKTAEVREENLKELRRIGDLLEIINTHLHYQTTYLQKLLEVSTPYDYDWYVKPDSTTQP